MAVALSHAGQGGAHEGVRREQKVIVLLLLRVCPSLMHLVPEGNQCAFRCAP